MNKAIINDDKPVALIVDDQSSICMSLAGIFTDENWHSLTANSGQEGINILKNKRVDMILLDVWMDGMDGIATLQAMKEIDAEVPIVIMSGHGTIETAVKATKLGAYNYLEKPLSLEKLLPMIDYAKARKGNRKKDTFKTGGYELVGESEVISALHRQMRAIAPRDSWVLITGENGVGKEIVARNIHLNSKRADKAFVAVNCAAIPEELIESELFGFCRGAFTNALNDKIGKFELADQGTLFLDEIGDMSLKTQAKILRILQEQTFERLGETTLRSINVRVIAATNKDLQEEIKKGHFREDLYYRLNVIPIHIAPLRDRLSDLPILANYFLQAIASEWLEPPKFLSQEAINCLKLHSWPGNVRELKNLVERLCILTPKNEIGSEDLPDYVRGIESSGYEGGSVSSLKAARNDFEKQFITDKLLENDWNVSKTADAIGVERSNLHRKIKSYGIDATKLKA